MFVCLVLIVAFVCLHVIHIEVRCDYIRDQEKLVIIIGYYGFLRRSPGTYCHIADHQASHLLDHKPLPIILPMHVLSTCLCKLHGFTILFFIIWYWFGSSKPLPNCTTNYTPPLMIPICPEYSRWCLTP